MSKNIFKKAFSSILVVSFLVPSFASAATSQTAEVVLLSNAIAIAAEGKPQDQVQQQLASIAQEYTQNSPSEGREDRLQDALVQLNVMTVKQAQDFRSTIDTAAQQNSDALLDQSIQTVLASLPGAQFSGDCETKLALGAIAGTASTVFILQGNTTISKPAAGMIIASLFALAELGEVYVCMHVGS
jgi:hypothetical protein